MRTAKEIGNQIGKILGVIMASLAVIGAVFLLVSCGAIVQGFVLSKMWEWFVVPLGYPGIGLTHSIGLAFMIRWLTWQPINCKKEDNPTDTTMRKLGIAFLYPFVVLFIGWFIHNLMA